MKLSFIILVFIMLINQSVNSTSNFKDNHTIEIIYKDDLDIKIYELKKVIEKGNYANHILKLTELITYEKLQDLKNIKDINLFIESYDTYNSGMTSSIESKVNYEGRYPYSKVLQYLIQCTKITINEDDDHQRLQRQQIQTTQRYKRGRDFRPIDMINNNNSNLDNSTLNNIKLENDRLVFCSNILEIYSQLKNDLDIDNEYYFSKDVNFIFEEVYTVGLQILSYKKDQEKIIESIYNEYGGYSNTLNLLNSYLEKKIN